MKQGAMKRIFLSTLIFLWALNAYAVIGVAGEPAPFLKMGVGARAIALSGAFCAYYDDATCAYWNPASIGAMKQIAVGSMFSWMTQDISHNYADLILPVDFGVFAFNLLNLSVGNIEGRTSDTPDYYTFSANDNSYFVTFAKQVVRGVCAGVNLKIISSNIYTYGATGISMDAGIHFKLNQYFSLGAVLSDFLNNLSWSTGRQEHILASMKIGGMAELLNSQLKISAEVEQLEASEVTGKTGMEFELARLISIRAGCSYGFLSYAFNYTLGGGLRYLIGGVLFQLDYAFIPLQFISVTEINHKFSLSAYF
jgi:hypothetical protein